MTILVGQGIHDFSLRSCLVQGARVCGKAILQLSGETVTVTKLGMNAKLSAYVQLAPLRWPKLKPQMVLFSYAEQLGGFRTAWRTTRSSRFQEEAHHQSHEARLPRLAATKHDSEIDPTHPIIARLTAIRQKDTVQAGSVADQLPENTRVTVSWLERLQTGKHALNPGNSEGRSSGGQVNLISL